MDFRARRRLAGRRPSRGFSQKVALVDAKGEAKRPRTIAFAQLPGSTAVGIGEKLAVVRTDCAFVREEVCNDGGTCVSSKVRGGVCSPFRCRCTAGYYWVTESAGNSTFFLCEGCLVGFMTPGMGA